MNNQFISINEAVTRYKISQSKLRKIIKELDGTANVQKVAIQGRHGFKYLISVQYLDALFNVVTEPKNEPKNDNNTGSLHDVLIKQLTDENKQLNNQINKQFETIKDLTTTLQEQNKIVIAQSLQISRLSEPPMERQRWNATDGTPPSERWNATEQNQIENEKHKTGPNDTKKMLTIELLIISILVVCIVAVTVYLFKK